MVEIDMPEMSSSAFNEAAFKMKRLHELQDRINLMRQNPMALTKVGRRAFRVYFDCLLSLYQEISAKCSIEERTLVKEKLMELRTSVRQLEVRTGNDGNEKPVATKTYELKFGKLKNKIEDELFDCEELIREYLDKHGFSTLNQETTDGDSYK